MAAKKTARKNLFTGSLQGDEVKPRSLHERRHAALCRLNADYARASVEQLVRRTPGNANAFRAPGVRLAHGDDGGSRVHLAFRLHAQDPQTRQSDLPTKPASVEMWDPVFDFETRATGGCALKRETSWSFVLTCQRGASGCATTSRCRWP